MTDNKKIQVEFAPGAFDSFEGTQEELDELIAEIQETFANLSPEELAANSRALTDEDLEELGEDEITAIMNQIDRDTGGRTLQ